jgi:hypothetical protein
METTVKKIFICLLAATTFAALPLGDSIAATKKSQVTKEQRSKLTEMAREGCRKKFGGGVTLRDIEFYNGKIKKIWCY